MKIGIANDHASVEMKQQVVAYLKEKGYDVVNYGTDSTGVAPGQQGPQHQEQHDGRSHGEGALGQDGEKIGHAVVSGEVDFGIAICGTGLGISLAANKVHGIRAAVCSEPYTARLSRQHNNANILAFGSRVIGIELAKMIIDEFLGAEFEGGRHQRRVDMIMDVERRESKLD